MKKAFYIIFLLFLALFLGACTSNNPQKASLQSASVLQNSITPTLNTAYFSLAEVGFHDQPADCWLVVGDNVFDLSSYIGGGLHPGSSDISEFCGQDASAVFMGTEKHDAKAQGNLDPYFIGKLEE